MKRFHFSNQIIVTITSFSMLLGFGMLHTVFAQSPTDHARHQGETDPAPLPFWLVQGLQYPSLTYAVALASFSLTYLGRRPPDLVIIYENLRI